VAIGVIAGTCTIITTLTSNPSPNDLPTGARTATVAALFEVVVTD
jgi:hypothetical protein